MSAIHQREDSAGVDGDRQVGDGFEGKDLVMVGILLNHHCFLVVQARQMDQHGRSDDLALLDIIGQINPGILSRRGSGGQAVIANQLPAHTGIRQFGQGEIACGIGNGHRMAIGRAARPIQAHKFHRDTRQRGLQGIVHHGAAHE